MCLAPMLCSRRCSIFSAMTPPPGPRAAQPTPRALPSVVCALAATSGLGTSAAGRRGELRRRLSEPGARPSGHRRVCAGTVAEPRLSFNTQAHGRVSCAAGSDWPPR